MADYDPGVTSTASSSASSGGFMSGLSLFTSLIGTGAQAYGQYVAGKLRRAEYESQSRMYEFQAEQEKKAARYKEMQAKDALKKGRKAEAEHRIRVAQFMGSQRASYGSSGVQVGVGAPAEVVSETALYGSMEAFTIRENAAREAMAYKREAAGLKAQAILTKAGAAGARIVGKTAESFGKFKAGTTLVTGMGSTALRYSGGR